MPISLVYPDVIFHYVQNFCHKFSDIYAALIFLYVTIQTSGLFNSVHSLCSGQDLRYVFRMVNAEVVLYCVNSNSVRCVYKACFLLTLWHCESLVNNIVIAFLLAPDVFYSSTGLIFYCNYVLPSVLLSLAREFPSKGRR